MSLCSSCQSWIMNVRDQIFDAEFLEEKRITANSLFGDSRAECATCTILKNGIKTCYPGIQVTDISTLILQSYLGPSQSEIYQRRTFDVDIHFKANDQKPRVVNFFMPEGTRTYPAANVYHA